MIELFGIEVDRRHLLVGVFIGALAVASYILVGFLEVAAKKAKSIDRKQLISDANVIASKARQSVQERAVEYAPVARQSAIGLLAALQPHFSLLGRMTRKRYILTQTAAGVGLGMTVLIAVRLLDSLSSFSQGVGILLIVVSFALVCWIIAATSAQRMRDTGVTVWWALTLLVPPLNLAAMAFLLFVPTDEFAGRGL